MAQGATRSQGGQQTGNRGGEQASSMQKRDGQEQAKDLVQYLRDFAHENPSQAALYCLGLGFILGWRLKPW